jgi:hypothetical protein
MSNNSKDKLLETTKIYSERALELLERALDSAQLEEHDASPISSVAALSRYQDSSDDDEEGGDESISSDEEKDETVPSASAAAPLAMNMLDETPSATPSYKPTPQSRKSKPTMDSKQRAAAIQKHIDNLPCLPLPCDPTTAIYFPSSLLPPEDRRASMLMACQSAHKLAISLAKADTSQQQLITILCLRSGRFAAAVYQQEQCLDHTTSQRYTVRKGQGKAQSAQDGNRRPKSMGAQLRRAGEQLLKQDVLDTLQRWKEPFLDKSALILICCPKTMMKDLFEGDVLLKVDKRIRRVPLDVGRPSFEAVGIIHSVLTTETLHEYERPTSLERSLADTGVDASQVTTETADISCDDVIDLPPKEPEVPLTPLHMAARDGNLDALKVILLDDHANEWLDMRAGEHLMTPLHYASQAEEDVLAAADCVYELLVSGRANPCVVDVRNRVPWYLAENEKAREAYRKARAELGEDYCDWEAAKVATALTDDEIQRKKDIEAEKKRKKRARQKQKKAEEKAVDDARAQQLREEAERLKQEEDAKRIRDSLQPKANTASNTCDFCQMSKKGLKRSQMLQRLDYVYCSSDCVQNHKRELMAAAAMKRLGGAS